MKVQYFIKQSKNPLCAIHVRFYDSIRIDQTKKTGLTVLAKDWNPKTERVKNTISAVQKDFINSKLRQLENYLIEQYNIDYSSGHFIGKEWLQSKVQNNFGRTDKSELHKIYFTDWVEKFIADCSTRTYKGKPIARRTVQHYETTINKLRNYESHSDLRLRHQDIDLEFYRSFSFYCRTIEKINSNTMGGYIANVKMWCRNIEIEGLPINMQYKHSEFTKTTNATQDVYLSEIEIDKVYNHDFSSSERLDNVKDNFIIGLRTGLRISDFMRLKKINFNGEELEIKTAKTDHSVIIPMHHQIQAILEKRNGELPHQISDQKFNKYVKELCKEVGFTDIIDGAKMVNKKDDSEYFAPSKVDIKNKTRKESGKFPKYELITSHTCRRSFASNLYGHISNMAIMAITGHKTETQFLKYIKITPREHADKLKKHWNEQEIVKNEKK